MTQAMCGGGIRASRNSASLRAGPVVDLATGPGNTVRVPSDREPDWEYAPLRIDPEVSRTAAATQLSVYAEFGGWELARVQRYENGARRVLLRRRRRPGRDANDGLPLPGLIR